MPAYLVSNGKISYIADYFMTFAPEEWKHKLKEQFSVEDAKALGALLWQLNANAIDQRYGSGEHRQLNPCGYKYVRSAYPPTAMPAYKAMIEWLYQAERGDIPCHPVFKMVKDFAFETAYDIIVRLQAYHEAYPI